MTIPSFLPENVPCKEGRMKVIAEKDAIVFFSADEERYYPLSMHEGIWSYESPAFSSEQEVRDEYESIRLAYDKLHWYDADRKMIGDVVE